MLAQWWSTGVALEALGWILNVAKRKIKGKKESLFHRHLENAEEVEVTFCCFCLERHMPLSSIKGLRFLAVVGFEPSALCLPGTNLGISGTKLIM